MAYSFSARNSFAVFTSMFLVSFGVKFFISFLFDLICRTSHDFVKVDTQIPGWEKSMIKFLKGIPGATFSIDANGLASVSGYVDPGKTLELLAKAGKHAQLYSIESGTNHPSEMRYHCHNILDDPNGRHWQANHQYHHRPYPCPPPSQYLPHPPMPLPPQHFLDNEPAQCMLM